ncbi:MAG TPA: DUF4013 domain-containing protein [Anaerolineales bacterium]|nr:DUF4013 domain-containing protein [Anaerolineales bacterium]
MGNVITRPEGPLGTLKAIFRLPFTGAEWPGRFLVGSLLLLSSLFIPILPLILVNGYGIRIMREAIQGESLELPPWDRWGEMAWDGLRASLIGLILLLPGMLVFFSGFGVYFLSFLTLPALEAFSEDSAVSAGIFSLIILGSFLIYFLSLGVGNLLLLLGSLLLPAITAHFAAKNRLAAIFQIGAWSRLIWRNKLGYLIGWVIGIGIIGIIYSLFLFGYFLVLPLCFAPILLPPLFFFILVVLQALFGEIYRESLELNL